MGRPTLDPTEYIGERFGMLTVIDFDHDEYDTRGHLEHFMKCRCDCGNERIVDLWELKSGRAISCGCANKFDINKYIGKRYGMLTVTGYDHDEYTSNHIRRYLKCHCDCGNDTVASVKSLEAGDKLSCGCLKEFNPSKYIGQRYNMLTIIGLGSRPHRQREEAVPLLYEVSV